MTFSTAAKLIQQAIEFRTAPADTQKLIDLFVNHSNKAPSLPKLILHPHL